MATVPELPPLQNDVDKIHLKELRSIVTKVVRTTTSRNNPRYGTKGMQPDWWPKNIPWTNPRNDIRSDKAKEKQRWSDALRTVIKSCYKHYGKEDMLKGDLSSTAFHRQPLSPSTKVNSNKGQMPIQFYSSIPRSASKTEYNGPVPVVGAPAPSLTAFKKSTSPADIDAQLYRPPNGQKQILPESFLEQWDLPSLDKIIKRPDRKGSDDGYVDMCEVFICFFCEKEFGGPESLKAHHRYCSKKSERVAAWSALQYEPSPRPRWCKYPLNVDQHKRQPIGVFIEALALLPKRKAEAMKQKSTKVDCDNLDLEDNPIPKSPTTPRSKMLLMTKDFTPPNASAMRSMSLSASKKDLDLDYDGGSDAESEISNSERSESSEDSVKVRRSTASRLLAIPLTSELGFRVRKHVESRKDKADSDDEEKEDRYSYEKFCHTPSKSSSYSRLRNRNITEYRMTFNKRREIPDGLCHKYKFNKEERIEFKKVVKTGLNARSRQLKRQTRECYVKVTRLSEEILMRWISNYQQPIVCIEQLSNDDIEKWATKPDNATYVVPMILDSPHFPATPEHISDDEMKRLLGIRKRADARSDNLTVPISQATHVNISQQDDVYNIVLPELNNSDVDPTLTPPATPPEQRSPLGKRASLDICETPKTCSSGYKNLSCPTVRQLLSPLSRDDEKVESSPSSISAIEVKTSPSKSNPSRSPLVTEPIVEMEPMIFYGGTSKSSEDSTVMDDDREQDSSALTNTKQNTKIQDDLHQGRQLRQRQRRISGDETDSTISKKSDDENIVPTSTKTGKSESKKSSHSKSLRLRTKSGLRSELRQTRSSPRKDKVEVKANPTPLPNPRENICEKPENHDKHSPAVKNIASPSVQPILVSESPDKSVLTKSDKKTPDNKKETLETKKKKVPTATLR